MKACTAVPANSRALVCCQPRITHILQERILISVLFDCSNLVLWKSYVITQSDTASGSALETSYLKAVLDQAKNTSYSEKDCRTRKSQRQCSEMQDSHVIQARLTASCLHQPRCGIHINIGKPDLVRVKTVHRNLFGVLHRRRGCCRTWAAAHATEPESHLPNDCLQELSL
jgi:hypothetical protein